jgi:hypothetical protein
MIERFVDATRHAADRVQDVCRALMLNAPVMPRTLLSLRRSLGIASGSAHQLGHAQSNPAFFGLRDQLDDTTKHITAAVMSRSPRSGVALSMLGQVLDRLWREGQRIATSRAVPRQDVLAMLDVRQKALVH